MDYDLTIAMPVRNEEAHLAEALESLSGQTFANWKCIVLDDCSTDGTGAILKAHCKSDPRFEVHTAPHHLGIAPALQKLLSLVETQWVARMDGDDICHPDRFTLQLQAAKDDPSIDLWGGSALPLGDPSPGWLTYLDWLNSIKTSEDILAHSFSDHPIPHPTWLARTEKLREVGGYRDGPFPEDYDLFLRLLSGGARFGKVMDAKLFWRDHPDRLTRTHSDFGSDAILKLKAKRLPEVMQAGVLKRLKRLPIAIRGAGKTGRIALTALREAGAQVEAFIDPEKAGAAIGGLPVLTPAQSPPDTHLILVAVRPPHLRQLLEEEFSKEGRELGEDYLWFY